MSRLSISNLHYVKRKSFEAHNFLFELLYFRDQLADRIVIIGKRVLSSGKYMVVLDASADTDFGFDALEHEVKQAIEADDYAFFSKENA